MFKKRFVLPCLYFIYYFHTPRGKIIDYMGWNKLSRNEVYNTVQQSSEKCPSFWNDSMLEVWIIKA